MSRYGTITGVVATTLVVQSSTAEDLGVRLDAALGALPAGSRIAQITLGAAGEGNLFTVTVLYAPEADVLGGIVLSDVRFYGAGQAVALDRAMQEALAAVGAADLADVQVVGSSAGGRFVGMLVFGVTSVGSTGPTGPTGPSEGTPLETGPALTDSDQTVAIARRYVMLAGTASAPREVVLDAPAGDPYQSYAIEIGTQAFDITITNGGPLGGQIALVVAGTRRGVWALYDGTDLIPAGNMPLGAEPTV